MKTTKRGASVATLGILAAILAFVPATMACHAPSPPTYPTPTLSLTTCMGSGCTSSPSFTIGTAVTDTATVILSADSYSSYDVGGFHFSFHFFTYGSGHHTYTTYYSGHTFSYSFPDSKGYGLVTFEVFEGTCSSIGSAVSPQPTPALFNVTGTGKTTYASTLTTTGLSAGPYVWIVHYTDPTTDRYSYPSASTCEPFTLNSTSTVPEFPLGPVLMLALAFPALLLIRSKFANTAGSKLP